MTQAADRPPGPLRLLVVEDHELLAGTLSLALRQHGIDVVTTTGPSRAAIVETARGMAPVLVLLDLELGEPLGSGLELVGPLRAAGGRVVMMTGVTDRARLGECVEAGAVGVVAKTVAFDQLIDAVRRAVEGQELLGTQERQELLEQLRARRRGERERLAPFTGLTGREQVVLAGLVAGEPAEAIAARSYVSLATVRSQIRSILLKLGVKSQLAAVAMAREAGWPPGDGSSSREDGSGGG